MTWYKKEIKKVKFSGNWQEGTQVTWYKREIKKVKFSGNWDNNKTKKNSKGAPLVITFHPLLKGFNSIKHKNLICYTWAIKIKGSLRLDP